MLGYFPEYMAVGCNVAAMLIATVASMATAISIHVVSFRCSQHIHAHTAVAAVYAGKAHISGRKGLSVADGSLTVKKAKNTKIIGLQFGKTNFCLYLCSNTRYYHPRVFANL